MTANIDHHQLARETAEYIARELTPRITHAGEGLTVVYADDRRPPADVDEITANLLDGVLWVSWMDDRVLNAMRALHGEPTGDAEIFA